MMKSFIPCFIFWSTALIRALTVASITGAKNLITTGFVAIFYPPQNNADVAQHISDSRGQTDKSQVKQITL
jgi:hypothetical protein